MREWAPRIGTLPSWQTNGLAWDFKGPVVRKARFEYAARGSVSYRSVMPSTTGCARAPRPTSHPPGR